MCSMPIEWCLYFLLVRFSLVNTADHLCNYLVKKSDGTFDVCQNNRCEEYLDPQSIMVRPNACKTNYLSLAFSTYEKFHSFLNGIQWKLGDLFPSKSNKQIRQLRIYIREIDENDRPIDEDQLNRLGRNIDFYQLYLENLSPNSSLYQLIHYDPNETDWDIIQIRFLCHSLIRWDEQSCSAQILPPPFFASRRPPRTTENTPLRTTVQVSSSSLRIKEADAKSIDLIILIFIPIFILLVTILISVFVYRRRMRKRSLESMTRRSSSIPSISHDLDCQKRFSPPHEPIAEAYQVSRIPSPHTDSLYKVQTNF